MKTLKSFKIGLRTGPAVCVLCVTISIILAGVAHASVVSKTLLVDDFADLLAEENSLRLWTGGGEPDGDEIGGLLENVDETDPGITAPYPGCHKVTYQDDLYQWWATALWDGLHPYTKMNILRYTHIAFEVKGAVGGEDFYVGLQETNKKKYDQVIKVSDFIRGGSVGTSWETVRIPLNKFIAKDGYPFENPGVNLNNVQAVDFMFYVPGRLSGTVYFTNMRFEGAKIDDFEDSEPFENLLRHPSSVGSGRMADSSDVADSKIPGNNCHKLTWVDDPGGPGYWYTNTLFDEWNVDKSTDITLYDTLNMRVRGEVGGEVFRIEFQEAVFGQPVNMVELSSSVYVTLTDNWQLLSVPLDAFDGVSDKNNLSALALLFNKSGDTQAGTIYVDDIYLAYDNAAPSINPVPAKTFYKGQPNIFQIEGTDPENDHLVYSAVSNFPSHIGAILENKNGLIAWTPASTGTYSGITISTSDGMLSSQVEFDIDVVDPGAFIKPESTGSVRVVGKKLFVDGKEFEVKGIGYSPVPIGETVTDPIPANNWTVTQEVLNRDMPVLRDMRVNTLRTWELTNGDLLDAADAYGLKVCATFWVNGDDDFTLPATQDFYIDGFKAFVNSYKDKPAVLTWVIGNEIDFRNIGDAQNLRAWHILANEMAKAAYGVEGEAYHPVALSSGVLAHIGNLDLGAYDEAMNYIDIWGLNAYEGYSFEYEQFISKNTFVQDYFSDYAVRSNKPLWISEYGIDSFVTTEYYAEGEHGTYPAGYPKSGYVDEATQSVWAVNATREISESSVCVGGTLMAYIDEWWKDGIAADRLNQDKGGSSSEGIGNDVHPDDYTNEEYWGLFAVADNGGNPDTLIKKSMDVEGTLYSAYDDLRDNCFNAPPVVTDYGTLTFYKDQEKSFYVVASDPNGDPLKADFDYDIAECPGATFTQPPDRDYGVFEWTPAAAGGPYYVGFTVEEDEAFRTGTKYTVVVIGIIVLDDPGGDVTDPTAVAGADIVIAAGTTAVFDGSGSWDATGIMNYQWDFDYDSSFEMSPFADEPIVSKLFDTPGTYTVALKVADGAGLISIDTLEVTVNPDTNRVNVFDNGESIQDALNAAASGAGDEVYVWSGEYTESLELNPNHSGISLIGEEVQVDADGCVLKGNIVFKEAANASVDSFTIEYPEGGFIGFENTVYPAPGLELLSDAGVTVVNCDVRIRNCNILADEDIHGVGVKYGKGIQVWNLYGAPEVKADVYNNLIRNADTGIFLFSQAFGGAIYGIQAEGDGTEKGVRRNTLHNNKCGIVERMHTENPEIYDNIFTDSQDAIHVTYADAVLGLLDARLLNIYDNIFWNDSNNVWCDEINDSRYGTLPANGNVEIDPGSDGDYQATTSPECDDKGWRLPQAE